MMNRNYIFLFFLFCSTTALSQLGFCTGSSGVPIFFEDFGSGTNYGPPLPAGVTNYTYVNSGFPQDGQYTLFFRTNLIPNNWHFSLDHTPDTQVNGVDGKCLIVNASNTPGQFYTRTVTGLCSNTTFEFSAWLLNILNTTSGSCSGTGIPINVTFEIWDATDSVLLRSGNTGNINGTPTPNWNQFGLVFTMGAGQTSVILKMRNNGAGGCGNDLAIDDIMFRACGEFSAITNTGTTQSFISICENQTIASNILTVNTSGSAANVYQWQQSTDTINYSDIVGQTATTYAIPAITATAYYRVKVAKDISNLNNPFCSTLSQIFTVNYNLLPNAPISAGDKTICSNQATVLSVTVGTGQSANWFDAPIGGTALQSNSLTYSPTIAGTYYAEAYNIIAGCKSISRTAVMLLPAVTMAASGSTTICSNTSTSIGLTSLNASATFSWTAVSTNATGFSNGTGSTIQQTLVSSGSVVGTVIYVITPSVNGCQGIPLTITVTVNPPTILTPVIAAIPTTYCLTDVPAILPTPTINGLPVLGNWNPPTITTAALGSTTYNFLAVSSGCVSYSPTSIRVLVTNGQMPDFIKNINLCLGDIPPILNVTAPNGITGTWNPAIIDNLVSGGYVFTPNPNQCALPQTIDVSILASTLSSINYTTTVAFTENQVVTILASGGGDYLYQLDNSDFQTNNIFTNVSFGNHIITVKEKNGCSPSISKDILIVNNPTFFTPNGDGFNDVWTISGLNTLKKVQVFIFDRYGKLVKEILPNIAGWDGTFNGNPLPADDYWFTVTFEENGLTRTFKSNFSLKR